jgi:hypothetical protein
MGFGGIEFAKADEPMPVGRDIDDVLEQPVGIIASNRELFDKASGIQETLRNNGYMPISVQDRKRLWGRALAAAPSRTAARNSSKR